MALVSMKRKQKPAKTLKDMPVKQEAYPYELRITLNKEDMDKILEILAKYR